jgi:signal transduction histidine kinase
MSDENWRILGLQPGTIVPSFEVLLGCIHHDEQPEVQRLFAEMLQGRESCRMSCRLVMPDGTVRHASLCCKSEKTDGVVTRLIGTTRDVTERHELEAQRQRSHAILKAQHEATVDGILVLNERARVVSYNQRFAQMWQVAPALLDANDMQALREVGVRLLVDPESHFATMRELLVDRDATAQYELQLHDGRIFETYTAPSVADDGEYLGRVFYYRDVTERRAIERMKREFVSVVSHELRTPLAAMRGALELLQSGQVSGAEQTSSLHALALRNTDRLSRLLNDILDLERLESGRLTLQLRDCAAIELVEQAVDVVKPLAVNAGLTLCVTGEPLTLTADGDRLVQTLTNLLSNAIKFSPRGGSVHVVVRGSGSEVLFEVSDEGRGIPADKLSLIFERFQQVDASDSRDKGGTGLGLAICRRLVEQHGGRIWAESVPGQGSRFSFTVPLQSVRVGA